jgi:hypothetical protein
VRFALKTGGELLPTQPHPLVSRVFAGGFVVFAEGLACASVRAGVAGCELISSAGFAGMSLFANRGSRSSRMAS